MKVLFSGGGTAGHINPAIAVAGYIKENQPDAELCYIGKKGGMESRLVPNAGIEFHSIDVEGFQRKINFTNIKRNISAIAKLGAASKNARKLLLELKPDVISLMGGVNDVWYYLDKSGGFDKTYYTMIYEIILNEIKKALPNSKIITFGTFVLPGDNTGDADSDKWAAFCEGSKKCSECNKSVAERMGISFTPLQNVFDDALKMRGEYKYWLKDGIHPTAAGHWLIAREWMEAFKKALG